MSNVKGKNHGLGFYTSCTLENGHHIDLNLRVGDVWPTQWGPRKVVKVERFYIEPAPQPTEPQYC